LSHILTVAFSVVLPVEINNPFLANQVRFQQLRVIERFVSKVATSAMVVGHSSN